MSGINIVLVDIYVETFDSVSIPCIYSAGPGRYHDVTPVIVAGRSSCCLREEVRLAGMSQDAVRTVEISKCHEYTCHP